MATAQLSEPIQFGKYTLFELIGRGGMAEVYKARIQGPAGFERTFVVKRILPHLSSDPTFIKMFVEEAKLSARLAHPNIVHIFELGAVEGEYFISMEYIRGHDLSETMRAIWKTMGPPRPEMVAYIGREACRGLAYAHALTDDNGRPLGMVHRDVSPSNVMLSYEGAVKLLDFGIAKALGDAGPETTKAGTMKGKYAYMAPEQTEGENVDNRSDIFACGIVLHEVLTGRRLFKGNNDVQTIERVRRCEVPRPSLQNPAVPPAMDAIILKALAHNPADRWADAAEMAEALDDIVHAARFQPSHLAQLLYDLFPEKGGSRPTAPHATLHGHTVTGSALRSSSVAPTSYTSSGAGPAPMESGPASLKPKSRFRGVFLTLVLLAGAGVAGWKVYGHKLGFGSSVAVTSAPSRRFFVYIKSVPEGANIYRSDNNTLMGATPVTLPIELVGTGSMRIRLEKPGYESFEQIVASGDPISISLTPSGGAPAAAADAGAAAAPAPKPHHRHHAAPSSGSSASPKPDNGGDDDSPPPSDLAPDPD
ncbi:MAG TPA: serine/threonine-protein kinase [Polyangia bacterium]|nr:serine/threonine-protein kinase [Polyangia bacterium]